VTKPAGGVESRNTPTSLNAGETGDQRRADGPLSSNVGFALP